MPATTRFGFFGTSTLRPRSSVKLTVWELEADSVAEEEAEEDSAEEEVPEVSFAPSEPHPASKTQLKASTQANAAASARCRCEIRCDDVKVMVPSRSMV
jgi:hypothetical protein